MREKVVVAWSGGKDSALPLYEVLSSGSYDVIELLTTVEKNQDRISIHISARVFLIFSISISLLVSWSKLIFAHLTYVSNLRLIQTRT